MPRTEGRYADLVGLAELALRWGASRQRAHQLTDDESFPEPVLSLRMGRVWHEDDVREWEAATGREADENWRPSRDGP